MDAEAQGTLAAVLGRLIVEERQDDATRLLDAYASQLGLPDEEREQVVREVTAWIFES